jgi:hypothetical protein
LSLSNVQFGEGAEALRVSPEGLPPLCELDIINLGDHHCEGRSVAQEGMDLGIMRTNDGLYNVYRWSSLDLYKKKAFSV